MNKKMIYRIIGLVLGVEAILLLFPFVVGLIYQEAAMCFLLTSLICAGLCFLLTRRPPENKTIYAKEGFVIVALSWIVMSLTGALPFVFSGVLNYVDALFEITSGFTTTGASVISAIESVPKSITFWRSFSHWIGGMGVLVFILSVIPLEGNNRNMHLMRAESPGPIVGKLVPKIKSTASLLYTIYTVMTITLIVLLLIGGMPLFDALCNAFGTAGTGGFSILNQGIGQYNNLYYEVVLTIFMILFGINFNVYFLLLMGDIRAVFKSEEVRGYLGVIFVFIALITLNLWGYYDSFIEALRQSSFQVASIITTTGYSSCDFNLWPQFSKTLLFVLMFIGSCAGSTGGGIKISRYIIMLRQIKNTISHMLHPRSVKLVQLDGKTVDNSVITEVFAFFAVYIIIYLLCIIIVSFDGFDFETVTSAVASCLGNVGPGLGLAGPMGNYGMFSTTSKLAMTLAMLFGRLEIFPLFIAFIPSVYRHKSSNF